MTDRPYTVLSCGVSLDGYLDDGSDQRLVLSNEEDLDRVDTVRAHSDAILVGAATVRRDNPRLLVRSPERRAARVARGLPPNPTKVTVTRGGHLDPSADFFVAGGAERLVYCPSAIAGQVRRRLGAVSTVVDAGPCVDLCWVSEDLRHRGLQRLMVEGGGQVLTQFLSADLADELQLVVAPFFVGTSHARRFVSDGVFPWNAQRRAALADVHRIGDVVLLRYALSDRFEAGPG